jgi:hypothetical protein
VLLAWITWLLLVAVVDQVVAAVQVVSFQVQRLP